MSGFQFLEWFHGSPDEPLQTHSASAQAQRVIHRYKDSIPDSQLHENAALVTDAVRCDLHLLRNRQDVRGSARMAGLPYFSNCWISFWPANNWPEALVMGWGWHDGAQHVLGIFFCCCSLRTCIACVPGTASQMSFRWVGWVRSLSVASRSCVFLCHQKV